MNSTTPTVIAAVAVKIDETHYYQKEFLDRYKVVKVEGVYVYNNNSVTHCCEISPSYLLRNVDYIFDLQDGLSDEDRDDLSDRFSMELTDCCHDDFYMHCSDVDALPADCRVDMGEYETMDDAIEDAQANARF